MVHWTDKLARTALLALAFAVCRAADAVAWLRLRGRAFLEELLFLSLLIVVMVLLPLLLLRRLGRLLLGLRLGLLWLLLHLLRLAGLPILLARSILATSAPAAMPLSWRLRSLTVVRRWPHFGLGLRCICRHACTS
ncbi:MAG TPA: hypothetical protein VGR76_20370 [Candidatus Angelobacter sp.]|nr:hypothetical protein [Candidatus Angelobacter sp.]